MKKLLIVYHSRTGNTEEMARAVCEGAVSGGATVSLKKAGEATPNDLLDCDAVIFGTCTNFGYMGGMMKEFFDQVWLSIGDNVANKPYSAFTCSRSGTKQALDSIDSICNTFNQRKQFKLKKAFEGIAVTPKPSSAILEECKQIGKKMAQL